jgi:biopolymer transport protein ExbD
MGAKEDSDIGGINDINITPFVDVVLVLLVIFIVTAPMMMKDIVQLKLPKVTEADAQSLSTLAVVITKEGQVVVNGQLQSPEGLKGICLDSLSKNPETQAVLSADIETRHGDVMRVIDIIKSSGIQQFAIQVEKSKP